MSSEITFSEGSIRPGKYGGKSNFSAWKFKTLAYLQSMGLKDVVVSSVLDVNELELDEAGSSVDTTSKKGKAAFLNDTAKLIRRKSEKAYAILLNILEDELIDLIAHVEAGDAHGVWTVLLETYEAKSTASLCYTLDQLMNIHFDSKKESFDMFKAKFIKLVLALKEMNEIVSPAIQRYVLLRSLPSGYKALVQSLKINDTISFEETCTHIKDYYESEKREHGRDRTYDDDYVQSVMEDRKIVRANRNRASQRTGKNISNSRECFLCGKKEHIVRDCPLSSQIKCSKCGGKGHVSRYCKRVYSDGSGDELSGNESGTKYNA